MNQQGFFNREDDNFEGIQHSSIVVPNVRDKSGKIIKPNQYEHRLEKDGPVMVNVFPMMWVLSNVFNLLSLKMFFTFKRNIESDGHRFYKLILNWMQSLPVKDIVGII